MGVATAPAISQIQGELDRIIGDPDADPAEKVAELRDLRENLAFLTGVADRYLGDQELRREASGMQRVSDMLAARENANVRGAMIDGHMASPEALDAAGMLSHDELDARREDGSLEESVVGIAHLFDPTKHPRGRGGKFAATGKLVPKGRRGNTLTGPTKDHRPLAMRSRELPGHHEEERPLFLGGTRTPAVRAELGSARDTKEKYSVPLAASPGTAEPVERRMYTPERTQWHREQIEKFLRESGAMPQAQDKRHVIFVGGGPASGKSSAEEYMPKLDKSVEIDQDHFKKLIDEYTRLAEQRDPYASDSAHREAADMAQMAMKEAMRRGYNIVAQGTGDSSSGNAAGRIQDALDRGYRPHVFYVSAPTDIAMERAKGRAAETGRAVPEAGLRAMHANVSRFFPEVEALAPKLESLQLWDSREDTRKGGKAHQMEHLDKASGKIVTDDEKLLGEFRDKQHEDPGTLIAERHYV